MKHHLNKVDKKENLKEILNFLDKNGLSKIKGGTRCCPNAFCPVCNPPAYSRSTNNPVPPAVLKYHLN